MKAKPITTIIILFCVILSYAQDPNFTEEKSDKISSSVFKSELPYGAKLDKTFTFYGYFITLFVSSDMYPESSLFNGQLVGRLFGQNSSTTSDSKISYYVEQRIIPFFIYQPKIFKGKALLRAAFEIDWTWGDQAYGVGGNKGGAISGDQVNIQTQNVEIEYMPAKGWAINLGLQRLFDTPFNPYRTFFDKMTTTGYRLAYWGTDAVGISVRKNTDISQAKLGFYKLYENNTELRDDVTLLEFIYRRKLPHYWNIGASVFSVIDNGRNTGGVSVFGQGLTSVLTTYNGVYQFNFGTNDYTTNVVWLGTFFSRNPDFIMDRFQLNGFFNYNFAKVKVNKEGWENGVDVNGFALNFRGAYRYGRTINDYISIDYVYSSGDQNGISDGKFTGVMTGNYWGLPASIFIGSGAYLLFPHPNVVNRFTPVVSDISNMGYGLNAFTINMQYDIIPNRMTAKIGAAQGFSNVVPQNGTNNMGTELNAFIKYQLGAFMSLEAHAANMWLGGFYDSNDSNYSADINGSYVNRPPDPWTAFIVFKWLLF